MQKEGTKGAMSGDMDARSPHASSVPSWDCRPTSFRSSFAQLISQQLVQTGAPTKSGAKSAGKDVLY